MFSWTSMMCRNTVPATSCCVVFYPLNLLVGIKVERRIVLAITSTSTNNNVSPLVAHLEIDFGRGWTYKEVWVYGILFRQRERSTSSKVLVQYHGRHFLVSVFKNFNLLVQTMTVVAWSAWMRKLKILNLYKITINYCWTFSLHCPTLHALTSPPKPYANLPDLFFLLAKYYRIKHW